MFLSSSGSSNNNNNSQVTGSPLGKLTTKNDPPIRRMDRNDKALIRTAEWDSKNGLDLRLEDKVSLADANAAFLQGLVVYVGKVHFAEGIWVGIQLTGPSIGRGNCSGVYKGKKYFADVGRNNGVLAPAHKVTKRLGLRTGDPQVDAAQQKRQSEQARLADLEFIDALCQTRALAMLKIHEQKQQSRFAGLYNKEEAHIARLKQFRYAELMKSRGIRADSPEETQVKIPEPNLRYAPRDSPLQQCDLEFAEGIEMTQQNFCLSDPTLPDNPITFASQAFLNMTGYNLNEILGKNCRFLQGRDTDPYAVYRIRLAIQEGSDCHVVLLNYRKDGTPFYNRLFMTALRDTKGRIKNYLGVQCEVSKEIALRINQSEKMKLERSHQAAQNETTGESLSERDGVDSLSIDQRKAARRKQRRNRNGRSSGSTASSSRGTLDDKSDHSFATLGNKNGSRKSRGVTRNNSAPDLTNMLHARDCSDSSWDGDGMSRSDKFALSRRWPSESIEKEPSVTSSTTSCSSYNKPFHTADIDDLLHDKATEDMTKELVQAQLTNLTEDEVANLYGW